MPKTGVLDPQGKAVAGALSRLGFDGVGDVRAGKVFKIEVDTADPIRAEAEGRRMAQTLLANPIIEEFEVAVEEALESQP